MISPPALRVRRWHSIKFPFVSFISNGVLRKICIGHDVFVSF
jgi:hypothetical protein